MKKVFWKIKCKNSTFRSLENVALYNCTCAANNEESDVPISMRHFQGNTIRAKRCTGTASHDLPVCDHCFADAGSRKVGVAIHRHFRAKQAGSTAELTNEDASFIAELRRKTRASDGVAEAEGAKLFIIEALVSTLIANSRRKACAHRFPSDIQALAHELYHLSPESYRMLAQRLPGASQRQSPLTGSAEIGLQTSFLLARPVF